MYITLTDSICAYLKKGKHLPARAVCWSELHHHLQRKSAHFALASPTILSPKHCWWQVHPMYMVSYPQVGAVLAIWAAWHSLALSDQCLFLLLPMLCDESSVATGMRMHTFTNWDW